MIQPALGEPVPDFTLPATSNKTVSLSDLKGKNIVLYFYPKDDTPGCTLEGQNFTDLQDAFAALDTEVLGVSRDSIKSHESFKAKFGYGFDLLSDQDEQLCRQFNVIKEKNMYGKKVMGIERSTFLIDRQGRLHQEWRKVKVDGHAEEVLAAVKALETLAGGKESLTENYDSTSH